MPGTITISDGGNVSLKITRFIDAPVNPDHDEQTFDEIGKRMPLILGKTPSFGPISLSSNLHLRRSRQFRGTTRSLVQVYKSDKAYLGAHIVHDDPEFSTLTFEVESADEWIANGPRVKRNRDLQNSRTIEWKDNLTEMKLPKNITLKVNSRLTENWTRSHNPRYSLSHVVRFTLSSKDPKPLSELTSAAHSITNFVCFSLGRNTTLADVQGIRIVDGVGQSVRLYYPSIPFTDKPTPVERNKVLLPYGEIARELPKIIGAWSLVHTESPEVLSMFLYAQDEKVLHLETRYMLVVSSLEALIKRYIATSGKTMRLPGLLREASAKVCKFDQEFDIDNQERPIVKYLVNFRNAIAHGDQVAGNEGMSQLWPLYLRLRILHQLSLMVIIGIPEDAIAALNQSSESRKLADMYPLDYRALSLMASTLKRRK